jgi:HPt (histidine-containing phosphotransfer) domain-containing protein
MTRAIIDKAVYDDLKDAAGADFVLELVAAFLEEAPGMFADLHAALDAGDSDSFRRAAHSIKSNANIFGAHAVAAPARALELMEVSGATTEVRDLITQLEAEFARASAVLRGAQDG